PDPAVIGANAPEGLLGSLRADVVAERAGALAQPTTNAYVVLADRIGKLTATIAVRETSNPLWARVDVHADWGARPTVSAVSRRGAAVAYAGPMASEAARLAEGDSPVRARRGLWERRGRCGAASATGRGMCDDVIDARIDRGLDRRSIARHGA